jgi:hypothetical protein
MSQDGFATFISEDLPGFNSLSGSGFFDRVGHWNGSSLNEDCFEVQRSSNHSSEDAQVQQGQDFFVFESECEDEEEDDEEEMADESILSHFVVATTKQDASAAATPRTSRRRATVAGDRQKRPSDGTKKIRRHRSNDGGDVKSVSSRKSQAQRKHSNDGPVDPRSDARRRASTQARRSHNLQKKSLDLEAKLGRLGQAPTAVPETPSTERRRMRRQSRSDPNPRLLDTADDTASAVSRQSTASRQSVTSSAGVGVGRRGDRRRRATQSHDLLARNLQLLAADASQPLKQSTMDDSSCRENREEAWMARRRRAEQLTGTYKLSAIAA